MASKDKKEVLSMLDEGTRSAIALKKFSLISPVINGQVKTHMAYYIEATANPIEMPYYGVKKYAPKTLESWYCDYMRGGMDALKPGVRGDKGGHRRIDVELGEKIIEKKKLYPKAPDTVIYEMLIKEGIITADQVSLATLYRFVSSLTKKGNLKVEEEKEMKRFSHQYINELWQTDLMYGPYITEGRKKKATYLFAYIDDASRLISHAQFYYAQNFDVLRHSFKEAVLKRGVPRLLYTDNGKIYRSQQFEYMCASLGCTLIHAQPFSPNEKGKIERFFLTVRKRFLSEINQAEIKTIEGLNQRFFRWLEEDYQRKPHSSLNSLSPLDIFMSQVSRIRIISDPASVKEKFLLRINRTVAHDATFTINNILFETDQRFASSRVEIRYDPEWLNAANTPVHIYCDDKKIGEGRQVDFYGNAHMKRKGRPSGSAASKENQQDKNVAEDNSAVDIPKQTISFSEMMGGEI
jgi:putative transposase